MAVNVLSAAEAFTPGAQLWVLPDFAHSHWTLKIDWYLNFQITKAQRHAPVQLGEYVSEVIAETGLPRTAFEMDLEAALLVPSERLLPNRWVACLSLQKDAASWVQNIAKSWTDLQKPSLRIFLPTGLSAREFTNLWKPSSSHEDITLVLEDSSLK